jgi:hypothetical protein
MKLCWLHRMALSWSTDSRAHAPRWARRHLGSCPRCRSLYHQDEQLITALRVGSRTARSEVEFPPFLHNRILANLQAEPTKATSVIPSLDWVRAVLIPALGVFLLAAYWMWRPQGEQDKALTQDSPPPILSELQNLLKDPNPRQALAWTEKLDQPLESEIHLVVSDAKAALQSLTANFLPERDH